MTEYTATTTNASNKLTAVPDYEEAEIKVELNDVEVTAGSDGKYALTWGTGDDVVEITVTAGGESETTTITVNPTDDT